MYISYTVLLYLLWGLNPSNGNAESVFRLNDFKTKAGLLAKLQNRHLFPLHPWRSAGMAFGVEYSSGFAILGAHLQLSRSSNRRASLRLVLLQQKLKDQPWNASGSKDVWKEKLSGCAIATTSNLGPWPWYPLFRQYRSVHLAILAMDHKWGTHEPTIFLYFGINPSMVGSNNLDPQNMLYRLYSYIQSPKMIWILDVFYRF